MNQPAESHDEPIDLAEMGAALLTATGEHHAGGRAAKTVFHEPGLRATVIALRAGHELAEHAAAPAATLYVHTGQVRLCSGGREQPLGVRAVDVDPARASLADSRYGCDRAAYRALRLIPASRPS
jgi:hypothetical protein